MFGLDNPIHLMFLLVIMLLLFGAKRLPEMGRSLGSGMRGFKDSLSGEVPAASSTQLSNATADPEEAPATEHVETRSAA
jgi:sec-independent protein translocase protein TatA